MKFILINKYISNYIKNNYSDKTVYSFNYIKHNIHNIKLFTRFLNVKFFNEILNKEIDEIGYPQNGQHNSKYISLIFNLLYQNEYSIIKQLYRKYSIDVVLLYFVIEKMSDRIYEPIKFTTDKDYQFIRWILMKTNIPNQLTNYYIQEYIYNQLNDILYNLENSDCDCEYEVGYISCTCDKLTRKLMKNIINLECKIRHLLEKYYDKNKKTVQYEKHELSTLSYNLAHEYHLL